MTRGRVERVGGSTYGMELGRADILQRVAQCASLGKAALRARKGAVCQSGGLATICTRSVGLLPGVLKRQAPVLRITGRCTRPLNSPPWRSPCRTQLSLLAHRVLDALRRHFHKDAALQHRARVRVEDLVKRASAPLKPFEHKVRRANLCHVVQVDDSAP